MCLGDFLFRSISDSGKHMSIMGGRFPVKPVEVLLVLGNVELLGGQHERHSLILLHVTVHHNDLILTLTQSEVN